MKTIKLINDDGLWQRIVNFSIDKPDAAFPFSRKLAKEENWTLDFTKKAIEEYKKFVYLCCILPNGASPSETVDKVWHMHLIYTQNYWEEFCPDILKRKLHHHPSSGGPKEKLKHEDWFADTLKNYREIFQQEAPEEIWNQRNEKSVRRNNRRRILGIFFMIFILFIANSCSDREGFSNMMCAVAVISGGVFFFGLIGALSEDSGVSSYHKKDRNNEDGSGGGCGGAGGGSGGSCSGGGCGGGCGGCGGCGGGCGG
ncbi:hypothetical protein HNP38_002197 [Chryseobacterium defluvii]|uniref:Uncharacterized protein n=1 Tax=Chryseobacterium defluvii TaxID=160396 RepID=A0A840KBX0_9FLAO|nr:hypothetical protein [Chryseobacterium defluvii]MBB4806901.1 hypothetical protein [Chryseobacterium defluvii]